VQESSASPIARRAVDLRTVSLARRLAVDYAHDFEALRAFYAGNPADPAAWRETIGRVQARGRDRARLQTTLEAQLARRGAPPAARAAAARLAEPETVAIVTGQQAGLFGGPLYTLLKALTAVKLAERTQAETGTPTVAVFWIDAEDHDWDEVATASVLDAELRLRRVTLPRAPGAGELPVASVALDGRITDAIAELRDALPSTEFTEELVDDLARAYQPGVGMAEAFGRWIERWLGHLGLVVFDAADAAAKPLAAPVFERELLDPGRTARLAAEAGAALEAAGYHAQVGTHPEAVALFRLDPGRHPIRRVGAQFVSGETTYAAADLAREAVEHPERFSPNVLLRPLVQDTIFPTVCYVSGPSELAYLGQLREVYAAFGLPMPLVAPRVTATLLDSASTRFLAKYGVPFDALQPQDEAWLNRLLESQLPPAVEHALHEAGRAVQERLADVIASVPAIDPTLEGAARSTLGKMEHDLRTLHSKVIHAAKRRDETLRRQFTRARALAFPGGHLQEREVTFIAFLNRYGPALVDLLGQDLPLEAGQHWVFTM